MKKRLIAAVQVIMILAACLTFSFAADQPVTIIVDSTELPVKGITQNWRTLVPVRDVTEAMGAEVTWVNETQQVIIWREIPRCYDAGGGHYPIIGIDHYEIMFQIGSNSITYTNPDVNDATGQIDVPAQLINDKTMIPLRAACEYLASTVEWDGATNTAIVTSRGMNLATQTEYEDWGADKVEQDAIGEVTDEPLGSVVVYITPTGCTTPVNVSKWVSDVYGLPYNLRFSHMAPIRDGGFFTNGGSLTGTAGAHLYDVPDFPKDFMDEDQTDTFNGIKMMSLEGNLWFWKADLVRLGLLSE